MRTRSRRNAYGVTKIVRDSYSSTWWDNRKKVLLEIVVSVKVI